MCRLGIVSPKPFVWRAPADVILDQVRRCKELAGTPHSSNALVSLELRQFLSRTLSFFAPFTRRMPVCSPLVNSPRSSIGLIIADPLPGLYVSQWNPAAEGDVSGETNRL